MVRQAHHEDLILSLSKDEVPSRHRPGLPRTVRVLGLTSLFMDLSSEIVHSLMPMFLVGALGASAALLGLIDGVAEATASLAKVFSGAWSDRLGRRKTLAVAGYALSALSKPLFPLAAGAGAVFVARTFDRLGKGLRGPARDALVADAVPAHQRGAAYGLRQGLDTVGALMGPLAAAGLLLVFAGDFRPVLWIACVPAFLAVAVLAVGVREPPAARSVAAAFPLSLPALASLGAPFWRLNGLVLLLLLPRFSEAFLLLRASALGLPLALVPLVLAAMNLVYAALSLPAGRLSDRIGRRWLVAAGFAVLVPAHALLALAGDPALVFAGAALWGLHLALTQAVLAALVADLAPPERRGTAFGVYHLTSGLAILAGSLAAGLLWDTIGPAAMFAGAAGVGALGVIAFLSLPSR